MKGKLLSSDWKKKTMGFHAKRQHCVTVLKKKKERKNYSYSAQLGVEGSWSQDQGTCKGKWSLPLMNSKPILDACLSNEETSRV